MATVEGFRHRHTGCLYFSAAAQAAEAAEGDGSPGPSLGVDADCQAHYTRADAVQTNVGAETQTPAPGAPPHGGRVITALGASFACPGMLVCLAKTTVRFLVGCILMQRNKTWMCIAQPPLPSHAQPQHMLQR